MSDDLAILVVAAGTLALGYRLWVWAMDARAAAYRIACETCSRAVVQLLDETVTFAGFRLVRNAEGSRRLLRTYTFDYTRDGFERRHGFVVLSCSGIEAVGLADDLH